MRYSKLAIAIFAALEWMVAEHLREQALERAAKPEAI